VPFVLKVVVWAKMAWQISKMAAVRCKAFLIQNDFFRNKADYLKNMLKNNLTAYLFYKNVCKQQVAGGKLQKSGGKKSQRYLNPFRKSSL
jgi:hypothetical protein